MGSQSDASVNTDVKSVYDELGDLLKKGDDVFVEQGPELLKDAINEPGFFRNVSTEPADQDEYTRNKIIGRDEHVIRFMEWPPEYALMPHEHHGRPCFEVLVDGHLVVSDLEATQVGENAYEFEVIESEITWPGESAVVDPRKNEIHAVYSPVRSRSLHVYPEDNYEAYGYVPKPGADDDVYERRKFQLREDE